ncbi:hypothetical protein AS850_08115 [Frondihabitans sp. 762G35]|nr:hypothetical protein AS850_08115 [Frondihabitans sp. 762G35]
MMDDQEHPIRRATFTPVDGVPAVPEPDVEDTIVPTSPTVATVVEAEAEAEPLAEAVVRAAAPVSPSAGLPTPPERGSLDDDDLVPLVGRHTEDTATVDLIGILQAQMQLRAVEAARFAAWEEEIRRIGTDEAFEELERTRLHFTGVIPIQSATPLVTRDQAPTGSTLVPERIDPGAPAIPAPIIPAGTVPAPDVPSGVKAADDALLESIDEAAPTAPVSRSSRPQEPRVEPSRLLLVALTAVALLVVVAALVLTATGAAVTAAATLAAFGVLAAAWLGIVGARLALRPRGSRASAPVTDRTTWALVAGLVLGTVVGQGLVTSDAAAFTWQGYLLRIVTVHGLSTELSVALGVIAAAVVAFVAVVVVDRGLPSRSASTGTAE